MDTPFEKMGIWALLPKSQHALFDQKIRAWSARDCQPEPAWNERPLRWKEEWLNDGSPDRLALLQRVWSLPPSHAWSQEENLAALMCSRLTGLETGAGTLLLGAAWTPASTSAIPGVLKTHLVLGEEGPIVWAHSNDMSLQGAGDAQHQVVLALEQTLARVFMQAKKSQSSMFNRWRTARDAWRLEEAWGPSVYSSSPDTPRL